MKVMGNRWSVSAVAAFMLAGSCNLFFSLLTVSAATIYVDLNCTNATLPCTNWLTAATNIQDAVDAATNGDTVLVTNGVYATGGRPVNGFALTNRVAVDKPLTVQSVNGPALTIIQGYQVPTNTFGDSAVRCAYLTNGAALIGFTLTNGATRDSAGDFINEQYGGGVLCSSASASLSNCILVANAAYYGGGGASSGNFNNCTFIRNNASQSSGGATCGGTLANCVLAYNSAAEGGGSSYGALSNCTLIGNVASFMGGGDYYGWLLNCTVVSNTASSGGGEYWDFATNCVFIGNKAYNGGGCEPYILVNCTIVFNSATNAGGGVRGRSMGAYNCIIYYNTAPTNPNYDLTELVNCCSTPPQPYFLSAACFTNEPGFADLASGDLRLQWASPCVNAGDNFYVKFSVDRDGNPRIAHNTVDVGAYEFQTGSLAEFRLWLQIRGLPTDGSADYVDPDGDSVNNWQEWVAGTDPLNPYWVLQVLPPVRTTNGVSVTWITLDSRTFYLERATDLSAVEAFSVIKSNILSSYGSTTVTDTTATNAGPYYYRVRVQLW